MERRGAVADAAAAVAVLTAELLDVPDVAAGLDGAVDGVGLRVAHECLHARRVEQRRDQAGLFAALHHPADPHTRIRCSPGEPEAQRRVGRNVRAGPRDDVGRAPRDPRIGLERRQPHLAQMLDFRREGSQVGAIFRARRLC